MNTLLCQSCGMPLTDPEQYGTNKDLSVNREYCCYCYTEGIFNEDCTMDEMIDHCIQFLEEFNKDSGQNLTKEEAITQMRQFFPTLKRWAKN